MMLSEQQNDRQAALVERLGTVADLCCALPLPGDLGDVVYDLLREAEAQIASDHTRTGQLVAVADDAIERVAEALYLANGGQRDGSLPFSQSYDHTKAIYRVMAKAAIAAMKDTQP